MTYVFLRFVEKWLKDGQFPGDELRARWWILGLGGVVMAILVVGLAIAWLD